MGVTTTDVVNTDAVTTDAAMKRAVVGKRADQPRTAGRSKVGGAVGPVYSAFIRH